MTGETYSQDPPVVRKNHDIIRKALTCERTCCIRFATGAANSELLGRLSIADAERRVWNKLRLRGRGVIMPFGYWRDIDKPSDVGLPYACCLVTCVPRCLKAHKDNMCG